MSLAIATAVIRGSTVPSPICPNSLPAAAGAMLSTCGAEQLCVHPTVEPCQQWNIVEPCGNLEKIEVIFYSSVNRHVPFSLNFDVATSPCQQFSVSGNTKAMPHGLSFCWSFLLFSERKNQGNWLKPVAVVASCCMPVARPTRSASKTCDSSGYQQPMSKSVNGLPSYHVPNGISIHCLYAHSLHLSIHISIIFYMLPFSS